MKGILEENKTFLLLLFILIIFNLLTGCTLSPSINEQTLTIQPGPAEGKDSVVENDTPDNNYGTYTYFPIGNVAGPLIGRGYLQFDLSPLPDSAVIMSANLMLYQYETKGTEEDFVISIHQITDNWEEDTITWNNQPNYLATPVNTVSITAGETTWLSWDITSLLQGWSDGSISNYGVILKDTDEALIDTFIRCDSSDYNDNPFLRPKLEITYYVP